MNEYQPNIVQRVRAMSDAWHLSGKQNILLLRNLELARAQLFLGPGYKNESPEVVEYLEQSYKDPNNGYDKTVFFGKAYCHGCSQRFSNENLTICTECDIKICPYCLPKDRMCKCGGTLVG
jgi:hypothetical protein